MCTSIRVHNSAQVCACTYTCVRLHMFVHVNTSVRSVRAHTRMWGHTQMCGHSHISVLVRPRMCAHTTSNAFACVCARASVGSQKLYGTHAITCICVPTICNTCVSEAFNTTRIFVCTCMCALAHVCLREHKRVVSRKLACQHAMKAFFRRVFRHAKRDQFTRMCVH